MADKRHDSGSRDGGSIVAAFRRWGFLQADLDWLERLPPVPVDELDGLEGEEARRCRRLYCGTLAAEFMHIPDAERRGWMARRMEAGPEEPDGQRLQERLAQAELFEAFLHSKYVGTKRFSLEGACSLLVLLDAVLESASDAGAAAAILGMSHRGRLNVMAHVVNVPASHIFAGFEDVDPASVLGGGDVKYHMGATGSYQVPGGGKLRTWIISNPSHLEAVGPVLMGRARAAQARKGDDGAARVVPVLMHGDAAFAGQGVAAETLNMSGLKGFQVGGMIHVVINNLIGFTTPSSSLHSSRFASDVARRLPVPILHVNGEDPEAVDRAGRMAVEYRARFGSDVVIDLICYRRYGHSEVDDPTVTQPLLYSRIHKLERLHRAYGRKIGMEDSRMERREEEIRRGLEKSMEEARGMEARPTLRRLPDHWSRYEGGLHRESMEVETAVEAGTLRSLGERLATPPEGFHVHSKVTRGLEQRRGMARGERAVDWGMAEALAFGSLLDEGVPVRISGQDSRRGTFGHRHSVLVDVETGREHVPLQELCRDGAFFETRDTILSEAASLGFEYGFSREYPEALVCWEAQFGDFINGAQVIVDQFISAGEDKWGMLSGLVLLLPHGYEGQGPEHSSARPERFLNLAAEHNIQLCQPTTAAQFFHLLRRQALRAWRKPLVVLTPKSLLRSKTASSPLEDLAGGRFATVLDDPEGRKGHRLLICSGKVAHHLLEERESRGIQGLPVVRLEQIYPFPEEEVAGVLKAHGDSREIVWVQEEPANMGALSFVLPHLERLAGDRRVTSVKRSESASPATGSLEAHRIEQRTLIDLALGPRESGDD